MADEKKLEAPAFQQKQWFIQDIANMEKILLEQAPQRGTASKGGFFTLVFVKETAF